MDISYFYLNFHVLKKLASISLTVFCMLLADYASASTNEEASKTKKSTEATAANNAAEKSEETTSASESTNTGGGMYLNQNQDSTNLNSVCKFNFIFYFIYKLKYDEEPPGNEYLNYEF